MSAIAISPRAWHARWQAWLGYHPQWWLWVIAGLAWVGLAYAEWGGPARLPAALSLNPFMLCRAASPFGLPSFWLPTVFWSWLGMWGLMLVAMMFPLLGDSARTVAFASPWSRRHRAVAAFLLGYGAVWVLYGVALFLAMALLMPPLSTLARSPAQAHMWLTVLGFGLAALWVYTPMRQRALVACHRVFAPRGNGWRADGECARFGIAIAWACWRNCWAIMLALMLAGHSVAAMWVAWLVLGRERFRLRHTSRVVAYCWLVVGGWLVLMG